MVPTEQKEHVEQVYLTPKQLSPRIGKSEQSLANDRYKCRGFPYSKEGKKVLYWWPDVHQQLQSKKIFPAES